MSNEKYDDNNKNMNTYFQYVILKHSDTFVVNYFRRFAALF